MLKLKRIFLNIVGRIYWSRWKGGGEYRMVGLERGSWVENGGGGGFRTWVEWR